MNRRMLLGVAGEIVPSSVEDMTPDAVGRLSRAGIRTVALKIGQDPRSVSNDDARKVRDTLDAVDISVAQSSGYNPRLIHPDPGVRAEEAARLAAAFELAARLGARAVLTGSGSLHPNLFYGPHPANHAPETIDLLVQGLKHAATLAEDHDLTLLIECHVLTPMGDPATIAEVLDRIGSPRVRANFDPVNLLGDRQAVYESGSAMEKMWETIGPRYGASAHLKDAQISDGLVLHIDEVPPGDGLLDYDTFFSICSRLPEDSPLIVEHLSAAKTMEKLDFVKSLASRHGISV